ncbi:hypothetical protein PAMP_015550 [Pampus punctatissimus]
MMEAVTERFKVAADTKVDCGEGSGTQSGKELEGMRHREETDTGRATSEKLMNRILLSRDRRNKISSRGYNLVGFLKETERDEEEVWVVEGRVNTP